MLICNLTHASNRNCYEHHTCTRLLSQHGILLMRIEVLLLCAGKVVPNQADPFSMVVDSDTCMAPVICDSPALALAQRPKMQLAPRLPHDSATSLVRLDMQLLPSPLCKEVVLLKESIAEHQSSPAHLRGSHGTADCSAISTNSVEESQGCTPWNRPVTMVISPDEHDVMPAEGKQCEEEFVLHSIPLVASPGSDSAADESPMLLSPDSPADRPMLPNSAPGFFISPSPVPFHPMAHDSPVQTGMQSEAGRHNMRIEDAPAEQADVSAPVEVDNIDDLNMLLK